MIVATDCCRAAPLLPFLQTLFDIALLRKGPEHIPRSVVILAMAIALWFLSALTAFALIDRFDESDFFLEIFSALIAVASYSTIVIIARRGTRLTQTMSAIIGCGAILMSVFVAAYVLLQPLIGPGLMTLVAWMILLWLNGFTQAPRQPSFTARSVASWVCRWPSIRPSSRTSPQKAYSIGRYPEVVESAERQERNEHLLGDAAQPDGLGGSASG